jgi:putative DNA primase/helicase
MTIYLNFLAQQFADRHGKAFKHFNGKLFGLYSNQWKQENTLKVLDMIRFLCREAAYQCQDPGEAKALCSAATVLAVEKRARKDPRASISLAVTKARKKA